MLNCLFVNPEVTLRQRYPEADFAAYFCFLAEHSAKKSKETQEHHICPKKQFPEYEDASENKITLTLTDHAEAHRILEQCEPSILSPQSAWILACSPERQSLLLKKYYAETPEASAKNAAAQRAKMTEEKRCQNMKSGAQGGRATAMISGALSHAGKISGKANVKSGRLAMLRTPAHQKAASLAGQHKHWHINRGIVNPNCSLCQNLDTEFRNPSAYKT